MKTKIGISREAGFTFIEMIIVVTILGLLVAIAVPHWMRARDNTRLSYIYSNLRVVESAKTEWAMDNHKTTGDPVPNINLLNDYFRAGKIIDIMSETYVPNAIGSAAAAELPTGVGLANYSPGSAITMP
jgi:prepilin-type N-terminal cleavage/methylation domain-containing protein